MIAQDELPVYRSGATATVVFNRPDRRNALTFAMSQRLPALLGELATDRTVKVVVLRGAGDRAFSAGADIAEFTTVRADLAASRAYDAAVLAAERALAELPQPVIAMVRGHCIGGGCTLALACDMRIAADDARFAITPAKLGLVYPLPSVARPVDIIGPGAANRLLMSADAVQASNALRMGLVDDVTAADGLETAVESLAETIASRAQTTVRAAKRMVAAATVGQRLDDERTNELHESAFASTDYAEGVRAFIEKRPPAFD